MTADEAEQQSILSALEIFPDDQEVVHSAKGYRSQKKSHTESFKELIQSGTPCLVKKDKSFVLES